MRNTTFVQAIVGLLCCSVSLANDIPKRPVVALPVFRNDTFNIVKYGAKADGVFLNTKSINTAIADCSKKGGGVVVIPSGFWLTGPVELKSNVNLHLQKKCLAPVYY